MFESCKINKEFLFSKDFIIPTVTVGIIVMCAVVGFSVSNNGKHFSSQKIAQEIITYINEKLLNRQSTAVLLGAEKENGLIKLQIKLGNNELNSYATTDGKLFFPQAYNLND